MHQDFLYIIAEVSATLAGFSGVVFILGSRAEGHFSTTEKNGLFHLLFTTCGNMLVVLIVAALVSFSVEPMIAWRTGSALMGAFVLAGAGMAFRENLRGEHILPRIFAWPVPIVAGLMALANLGAALGFQPGRAPMLCISLSIYLLFVAVTYFTALLVPEPVNET
jgi:hypothetical protein